MSAAGSSPSDDELDPDEPRTPLWLPLLGLCLFVAALAYALTHEGPKRGAPGADPSAEPAQ